MNLQDMNVAGDLATDHKEHLVVDTSRYALDDQQPMLRKSDDSDSSGVSYTRLRGHLQRQAAFIGNAKRYQRLMEIPAWLLHKVLKALHLGREDAYMLSAAKLG